MNNTALKLPNPQQHERVFLDDLIRRYKSKLISAANYILSVTNIYRPKGQRLSLPSAKVFYTQFGIAKSTFYRALKRLKSLPEFGFHWEPNGGITLWCGETEDTATPSVPEKESAYSKLKELPAALRNEFEIFVKREWRKIKGQEIRSFHRFVADRKDFQNWWTQFQEYEAAAAEAEAAAEATAAAAAAAAAAAELEPSKRTFSPIPEKLKGLFGKKPT